MLEDPLSILCVNDVLESAQIKRRQQTLTDTWTSLRTLNIQPSLLKNVQCREWVVSHSVCSEILYTLHNGHYLPVQYNTVLMSLRLAGIKLKVWVSLNKWLVNKTLVNKATPSCGFFFNERFIYSKILLMTRFHDAKSNLSRKADFMSNWVVTLAFILRWSQCCGWKWVDLML